MNSHTFTFKTLMTAALLALASTGLFAADPGFGARGAADKGQLTLEQMLTYAIEDEYLARAEYEAIIRHHGAIRPFTNIIRGEEQHIAALGELFTRYGLQLPADTSQERLVVPGSLKTALEAGVEAELENIAMYEAFLGQAAAAPLPADVRELFQRLKSASENHLRAFRNNLARYN